MADFGQWGILRQPIDNRNVPQAHLLRIMLLPETFVKRSDLNDLRGFCFISSMPIARSLPSPAAAESRLPRRYASPA